MVTKGLGKGDGSRWRRAGIGRARRWASRRWASRRRALAHGTALGEQAAGGRWAQAQARGAGVLGRGAAGARARGVRAVAEAWACGARTAQAWARLCTPGCARLGQVGCFVHSDSVFDLV